MSEPNRLHIQVRRDWYIGRWHRIWASRDPLPHDLIEKEFGETKQMVDASAYDALAGELRHCKYDNERIKAFNDSLLAKCDAYESTLRWLRDGIEHFNHEDDQLQVEHLYRHINEALEKYRGSE